MDESVRSGQRAAAEAFEALAMSPTVPALRFMAESHDGAET